MNNYQKELEEILQKIEEGKDVRAFCPDCGEMRLLEYTDINCPYGDEMCIHSGYSCSNCYYEWEDIPELYSDNENLIEYNKKRFEQ